MKIKNKVLSKQSSFKTKFFQNKVPLKFPDNLKYDFSVVCLSPYLPPGSL